MAKSRADAALTRRERQIMDLLYARQKATASDIQQLLPDDPSYSTVRTLLRILENKGFVRHREEGIRYVYEPAVAKETARKSALCRLLETFFDGSAQQAVVALLDPQAFHLSEGELEELSKLIEEAKGKHAGGDE